MAHGLLKTILGEDATGKTLRGFSIHAHVRKVLKSKDE